MPALGAEVVLAAGALDEGLEGGFVELGVDEGVEFAGHGLAVGLCFENGSTVWCVCELGCWAVVVRA